MLGEFIGQHHDALIDAQRGVTQLALEIIALEQLGFEGARIEIYGRRPVADAEIGRHAAGRRRMGVLWVAHAGPSLSACADVAASDQT